jgi:transposase-like protein
MICFGFKTESPDTYLNLNYLGLRYVSGVVRLHKVNDASGASLIPAVKATVKPKSEVCTDDWEGYSQLSSSDYQHTIIRKTAAVGENLLPLTNRVAALLKRWLLGTHQGKPSSSHLDYYLDEFVFRFGDFPISAISGGDFRGFPGTCNVTLLNSGSVTRPQISPRFPLTPVFY